VAGFDAASSPTFQVLGSIRGNLTSPPTRWLVQQSVVSKFGGTNSSLDPTCSCPPHPK
jgi:hypothetical protein